MTTTGKRYSSENVIKQKLLLREGSYFIITRNLTMCRRQVVKVYLIYPRGMPVEIRDIHLMLPIEVLNFILYVYVYIFIWQVSHIHDIFLHSVKFSIKSFKVPELYVEMPETSTVGSLKVYILIIFSSNI